MKLDQITGETMKKEPSPLEQSYLELCARIDREIAQAKLDLQKIKELEQKLGAIPDIQKDR
jgi:hypothetical protein